MLKENQLIEVTWLGNNRTYYEDKGYIFSKYKEKFKVRAEDLPKGSHAIVEVICDFCGEIILREYKEYLRYHNNGDCCEKCLGQKSLKSYNQNNGKEYRSKKLKETFLEKYGVENMGLVPEFQEKALQTHLKKYGTKTSIGRKEINKKAIKNSWSNASREKRINTNLEKYGTEYGLSSSMVREKITLSFYKNGTTKTSKQQELLYEKLKEIYNNCEINYPCGRCSLDCVIEVDGVKIDIEYDGIYWHKDKEDYDRKRDYFVRSQGYKIIRIKGNHDIPQEQELIDNINILLTTDKKFIEINMV